VKAAFLRTGKHSGPWNMAFDLLLMEMVRRGRWSFVLRTYGWEPACVSMGKLQKTHREIDSRRLLAAGYGLVRRPTGGRCVWHETEVTYSITAPDGHSMVSGSLRQALQKTSRPMLAAMEGLGIPVEARGAEKHRVAGPRVSANPCFTSHGMWEVGTEDGRKLVGSAQARSRGVFLEHGSILLSNDQLKILDFLPPGTSSGMKELLRRHLESGIASLREFRPELAVEDVEDALLEAYSRSLGTELEMVDAAQLEGPEFSLLLKGCRNDI